MNELKFDSQVCTTKEQSQHLLELGLKPETAECYNREEEYGFSNWIGKPSLPTDTPAWSLHRLLLLYNLHYIEFMNDEEIESVYNIVIDAIEQAIKEGYFNKEYLE